MCKGIHLQLNCISQSTGSNNNIDIDVPHSRLHYFIANEHDSIERNCYYRPQSRSFAGIDSFIFCQDNTLLAPS